MTQKIYPIILCGGSGTRLWPVSRQAFPKQFAQLTDEESLFQKTVKRLSGPMFADPVVVANNDFRFIVTEQLSLAGASMASVLIEPSARNTAPAVLASAMWLQQHDPDALMLLAPSDHLLPENELFTAAVTEGITAAKNGELITFGIKPDRPETGYGWLELNNPNDEAPVKLKSFIEKPDLDKAKTLLENPACLWNSGIFMFSVKAVIAAFTQHAPQLLSAAKNAVDNAKPDLGFLRLDEAAWAQLESISIDYAIMEKSDNISVVPYNGAWSDLGGWDAIWRISDQDSNGVAAQGKSIAIDCQDTLIRCESDTVKVVGIGLSNTIVVAMSDAVLVIDKDHAQKIGPAVKDMMDDGIKQAKAFPTDHRPWGWFETLALRDRYQVKKIVVKPGGILSLQSHMHRSEHWTVVSGTAKVTLGDKQKLLSENESIYIPLGMTHRMENPGKLPMVLIEVQTGPYLGEDDIVRYEDAYSRD